MKRFIVMAVFALVFITTSAQAADKDKGMYVSGSLGLVLVPDLDQTIAGVDVTGLSLDIGFGVSGAIGYDFGTFRAEGEISYRANDADEGTLLPPTGFIGTGPADGDVTSLSFMINGYYDFHSANSSMVPYLGVGLGVANIDADVSIPSFPPGFNQLVDDSATVFAYQFMAGLGFNVSPTTTLTVDYRYFATSNPEFTPGNFWISGLPDYESNYSNHLFNIGARFMF